MPTRLATRYRLCSPETGIFSQPDSIARMPVTPEQEQRLLDDVQDEQRIDPRLPDRIRWSS
jgi:hypothetical protein